MPILHDPAAYRKRSTPIKNSEAQDNAEKFMEGIRKLMNEFHIADCLCVAEICVEVPARDLAEEDSEAFVTLVAHIGDQNKSVPMAAYGHAFMNAEFQNMIAHRKAQAAKRGGGEN